METKFDDKAAAKGCIEKRDQLISPHLSFMAGAEWQFEQMKSQLEEIKKDSDRFEGGLAAAMREISDKDKEIQALKEENQKLKDMLANKTFELARAKGNLIRLSQGVKSDGN